MKTDCHKKKISLPVGVSLLAIVLALSTLLVSCGDISSFFISADDERKMGDSFHANLGSMLSNEENPAEVFRPVTAGDSALVRYFDSLAWHTADQIDDSDMEHLYPTGINSRRQFFRFTLIRSNTVNAFAVPGGYVYLYTGILREFQNEAELVGVIAHELGHIVMHHSRELMLKNIGASTLSSLLLGDGNLGAFLTQAGTGLWLLSNSRENEFEADSLGVLYAARAGIKPNGIETFFMRGYEIDDNGNCKESTLGEWGEVLSTHPASCDRALYARAQKNKLPEAQINQPDNATRYRAIVSAARL